MLITRVKLQNWRNFSQAEAQLRDVTYFVGANATGKSNLLDVFRFLRDIAKAQGGGIQKAIADRGGLAKLRCLHARKKPEVIIEVDVSDDADDANPRWRYTLAFKSEVGGARRPIITAETVVEFTKGGAESLRLNRPDAEDHQDRERLTQTAIEQIQSNAKFRPLVEYFAGIAYLHLVPQLLKFGEAIGSSRLEGDPFGQGFLERVAKASDAVRKSRLQRIQRALAAAIPQFQDLRFLRDETGRPHLEAQYTHHRPHAGWQREDQFSDGTLRLIALFWLLMDGEEMLLLEEPELSLDEQIVRELAHLIDRARRTSKKKLGQILISTHSEALLANKGIDGRGVVRLERANEGTKLIAPSDQDLELVKQGFSPAEIFLPKVHPKRAHEMVL